MQNSFSLPALRRSVRLIPLFFLLVSTSCAITTSWDRNAGAVRTALAGGKLADADRLADEALAYAENLPEGDARRTSLIELKARIADLDGRHADAAELYTQAVALRESEFGEGHPRIAPLLLTLARVELTRRHPEAAIELLDQLLAIDSEDNALAGHLVGQAYGEKAEALSQLEQWTEAESEYRDAASILSRSGPLLEYHRYQRANVRLLRRLGKYGKAETIEASFRPPDGNYLWNVLVKDPRKHFAGIRYVSRWRRDQMPLRVRVPLPPRHLFVDPEAIAETVKNAVRVWEDMVEPGVPSFLFVDEKDDADIPFRWVPRLDYLSRIAETQRGLSPTGRNFSVRYIAVGTQPLLGIGDRIQALSTVITHETGHALGLYGHSPSPIDTMYPSVHMINLAPSQTDVETIRQLYSLEPGTLVKCPAGVWNCSEQL